MSADQSQTLQQLRRAVALQRLQQRGGVQLEAVAVPPIRIVDRNESLPLSWAQQRLWFLDQFDHAAGAAYHIPMAIRLTGALDRTALQASLDRIVARHEGLRTTFVNVEGEPRQVIAAADGGFSLIDHDLRHLQDAAQAAAIAEFGVAEANAPFDLASGPLIRGRLLRLAEHEYVLLLTQHHIVSDGWSTGVLVKEVSALYAAFSQGQADPLPPLPIQYADYAAWQRQWLQGDVLKQQIDYWREHLGGAPALLELPTDRPRPAVQSYRGDRVPVRLSRELSGALRALSQRHGVTVFMTLLAGWSALLARLSGQDDVMVGTPIANRQRAEVEPLIGFFVNTLALRVDLSADPSVAALLAQVKATMLGAYEHQDLPFEQVVEALQPERSLGYSPIFQVMLSLNNTPAGDGLSRLPGLTLSGIDMERQTAQFELSLSLNDTADGLAGSIGYATDLYERSTVQRMLGHWTRVLEAMIADDSLAVSRLPLLSEQEREQLLITFNATRRDYPHQRTVHALFEAQAAQRPQAIAIAFEGQRIDYGDLNRRANRVAHRLIALGIGPDDCVAICTERNATMIVGMLGILKAGAAYVPLDPAYPADRRAYILDDSRPKALLTQFSLAALADESITASCTGAALIVLDADASLTMQSDHDPVVPGLTSSNLAYVIYTSGTTGQPKGVMVEHRGLVNYVVDAVDLFGLVPGDTVLQQNSLNFDVSVEEILPTLCGGATVAPTSRIFGAADLDEAILPSVVHITAAHWHTLVAEWQRDPEQAHRQLQHVRLFNVTGDAVSMQKLQVWDALRPPSVQLINTYGPTETTVTCTAAYVRHDTSNQAMASVTIGKPLANTQIYILDAHLQPVPIGVAGEIYIGGDGVTRGYLNRPGLTAERFLHDPFASAPAARMYKSGDRARYLEDGNIEFLGRNDFQVKIRGFRVELGEVEAKLSECAGVCEAVVVAAKGASDEKRLVAYVVPHDGVEPSAASLREELSRDLPDYMIPSAFVRLDAFPLTPNGKLDRKALPAPDPASITSRAYAAPVGDIECVIAEVWQELLGLERAGRHDHFFELGGHSLLVIRLIERLRRRGLNADVRMVFMTPMLHALANQLADGAQAVERASAPPNPLTVATTRLTPELLPLVSLTQEEIDGLVALVPGGLANIQDIYPLAPLQEGILFHHLIGDEGDTYLLRTVIGFDSQQRMATFLGALQQVVDRHDILRSAVHWEGLSQPIQIVHRHAPLPVTALDAIACAADSARFFADTDPRRLRLDLRKAPMLAAYTAHDARSGEWQLALLLHHMASDHITQDLILAEIQMLLQGRGDHLPAAVPYRNFIAQIRAVPESEHEAYFRSQLADVDEPTAPFGVAAVQEHGRRQQESAFQFNDALALDIRESARRHGVTPAVLFHVAWAQVVAECSGRDDVVFGTVLSGRLQGSDTADQVVGMFINSLPIRMRLAQLSVAEAVREAYARLSDLLLHEQAPLALAQRCSGVPSRLPLFTALLNYRYNDGSGIAKDAAASASAWEGIRVVSRGKTHGSYPLTLSVEDWGRALGLSVLCVPDIDGARLLRYLETAMTSLVAALADTPSLPIRRLAVLPQDERAQLLAASSGERTDYPHDRLVHELFEAQARQRPDAVALTCGEASLSYCALNRRANQLAHYLRTLGIKPDARVAICMERGIDMVVGLLGVLKAGGAYVPLDPANPAERLAAILKEDPPLALLTLASIEDDLPAMSLLRVVVMDDEPAIARQPEHDPAAAAGLTPEHLAYVIYTSGSSGQPKGVMVPHRGVVNYLAHAHAAYLPDDIRGAVVATPLGFDATLTTLLAPWLAGKPVALLPEDAQACLLEVLEYLRRPEPWLFKLTPAHLDVLSSLVEASPVATPHRLVVGGEQLTRHSLARFRDRVLPNAIVVNEYGPTEAVVGCTTFVSDASTVEPQRNVVPIGRPIANTRTYLLGLHGAPVPVGVVGEIHIGGIGVARGYLNRPDLTEERFLADPFVDDAHARMYRTGDLARWLPEGDLEYLGRNDFQVKVRGFRIELGEIEAKLSACKGVLDAVVIVGEDASGDQRLVAYVVPEDDEAAPSAADLRERLSRELPDYMVPSAFVGLAALPLTANGKIDRKALPAPDLASVASRDYEAPVGDVEQAIAAIWRELLGLEQVGRHDHFFELGGHSLLAVRLVTRLRAVLDVEVALRDVFEQPTLSQLSALTAQGSASSQTAIACADRDQALPLSWAQQRLWFLDQFDHVADAAYHIPAALRLQGELNRSALRASLDAIVARHENLRTTFVSVEGEPRQLIGPADSGFSLAEHDLRNLDETSQAATVRQLSGSEARAPFDLSTGPLIRGRLLQLGEHEHVLLVTQHHIISDGWSIGVLVKEVSALYTAFAQGRDDPLPPLPIQYADYAMWQRQWLQGDVLQAQVDFWRAHLSGAPALLELPTDRPRPAVHSYDGDSVQVRMPPALGDRLNALAQRHGATLFMALLAGWSALLSRLSGQGEVVIGSPVANRQRVEIEPLIGFFVNTLALRVDLSDDPSVAELLAQIKRTTLAAYAHQDLPFEQVVETLQPVRSLSHNALFQVALTLNNTPVDDDLSRLPGLTLSSMESALRTARFDLSLSLVATPEGLVGSVIYATALFDRATIERMMGHWVTLLEAMVADDAQRVSGLPLLTTQEHDQLLRGFNATHVEYPHGQLLHARFEAQSARTPDAIALEYEGEQLSYSELNRRANRVAHRLIAHGVKADDRIALCAERSLAMVVGVLGILKAGAAYVPMDPLYPADRLAYMLDDSRPVAVLTQSSQRERLPAQASQQCPLLLLDVDFDTSPDEHALNPSVPGLSSRHLAYVIYTSGSTGQPKGVMVEHASVMNLQMELEQSIFGALAEHDRVGLNASLSFDASVKSLLQLLSGRCVVIVPAQVRADADALLAFLARSRIDAFDCTPAQLESLLAAGLLEHATYRPQAVLIGGDAISANTWQRLGRSITPRFFNVYGPTECTVDSALTAVDGGGERPNIGKPIGNARIYILDARRQPVPIGACGELYIAGMGVARGYLHRPELTAERFLKDPFSDDLDARMYKSGDLGRWLPNGSIEYLGRNDQQVKIRGFRVELGEIEAKLAGCPGVREAVVIAREDVLGDKRLVAYVVRQENADFPVAELRDLLLQDLPEYMIPSACVLLDALPLTPNGKLDRKALPAPDQAAVASRIYEAPEGEAEQAIAEVWQELLGIERVGRHDHFFELGGHSLLAVRVVVRLKEILQVDIDLRDVFITPQLSALANIIIDRQFAQFDQTELLTVLGSMQEAELRE
ncbi:amino acid adenylation domain-containing protein [Xanthomonas sp. NCPPB 2654]|uniref:non-ribosomal peptide synthetase n=1 Tax=unclassified Xanthomonas TaxID=2643310 RepID=UPI0021E09D9C|nr:MULTISPECIES: non-ribosomal peptide synthetase [unclassified Xanthomonas]MDL5368171.1 amino acid adenylation domain-containing protein [Xanthomonas sp. NCPPB 2654]UYC18802.1 amino acid adenylation domain-containing protein [Xanthomonas sp. CFBP 8443]